MTVTGTYRLQLHDGFTFADAAEQLDYLSRLGVSHLYLSPILQAAAGSQHGYDVVDHTVISAALGGREGFEALARKAHERGLGIIVDVVPNHMAFVAPQSANVPVWLLLRDGRDADTAHWFDVDWKAGGGRIGLPILGSSLEEVLDSGELVLDEIDDPVALQQRAEAARAEAAEDRDPLAVSATDTAGDPPVPRCPVLRYHEHVLPIALGTDTAAAGEEAPIAEILDRQHYRLTSWRGRDDSLNYRRFFEVDQLIAIRVELDDVFDETHALLLELNHAGLIDGFRIDHPDGLADPAAYLERLAHKATRKTLVWVEKILEGDEELPGEWACAGTTGYDALRTIQGVLVDTGTAVTVLEQWRAAGGDESAAAASAAAKRQVVEQLLVPEVERLTRRAREVLPELDPDRLRAAVVELLLGGQVYRAYVRPDERLSAQARERLATAFARAQAVRPDLEAEFTALLPLAAAPDDDVPASVDFSVRLQQTWGPVMAKGIEDTVFYRWHALDALNEVGGDPDALVHGGLAQFHRWARHQGEHWPHGMTALSTHDTKRSEDVRARLLAVAGDEESWRECSQVSLARAEEFGIDATTAHFLWQTSLGVGPIDDERLTGYVLKAIREAKQHTAWVDGDPVYEEHVLDFVRSVGGSGPLHDAVEGALSRGAPAIRATILAAKVLQLTVPGIPDTYQGCEIVDLSLVDPDNRRPVDYHRRSALLEALDALAGADLPAGRTPAAQVAHDYPRLSSDPVDVEKLLVTSRLLRLRRDDPDLFGDSSTYTPLAAGTDHVVAFQRVLSASRLAGALGLRKDRALATVVTRAPARLAATGGWRGASVSLSEGTWTDVFTSATVEGGDVPLEELFATLPVAVLLKD